MLAVALVIALGWGAPDTPEPFERDASEARMRPGKPPPPASIMPTLRQRTREGEGPERPGAREDVLGDRQIDRVRVNVRADGSAKVDVPKPFYARGGLCAAGLCLGTRGVKRQSKKPIELATAPILLGIGGTFGFAPASSTKARAFLAQTREQRVQQAISWQRDQLAAASGDLSRRLASLLHDDSITGARRRAIVFELWDDAACAAESPMPGDAVERERKQAAARVRGNVEEFVQRWLPRGTARGYSESELARLNARRCSARPFRPYGS